ncbi:MAG: methionyl-tRNA formyltransferase [Alphaproteobacteria bacterium]|nr:MAG: methionyl-tRNA formyltransferase [Alphaproteobacteria bacterium]
MAALRLAFMGTPDFAVPSLEALIRAGHQIVAVYTQPPRPAGRGKKPRPSPVHQAAAAHGIPVFTPARLKDAAEQDRFRAHDLDAAVVVAYGLILPRPILDAPRFGCINVHASLLPRWRGAAPIQRAIMAGDAETGVSIMKMDEGLDTGPVLATQRTAITSDDTAGTLHDRLAKMGAALLVPTLVSYATGALHPRPQPEQGVTYASKIDKDEARIDWTRPAAEIARQIRAMAPYPGAWCLHRGNRLKVLQAEPTGGERTASPGTVVAAPLTVQCKDGGLALLTVQRAGKSPMTAEELVRGYPLEPGESLE